MTLNFTKMHGLGNDFVVIDAINQSVSLTETEIRAIADRHFGIGCDQVLLVEPAQRDDIDFVYRIYNADGGEVEQCGNGARCFARFVLDKGLTSKRIIRVETSSGLITLQVEQDEQVTVDMGRPQFSPRLIPFDAPAEALGYDIDVGGMTIEIGAVSMGNPHAVVVVEDVDTAPVADIGPRLEHHPRFPQRTNVGFLEIVDSDRARLRVHERGAGETLACGTGACAALVYGRRIGALNERATIELPGGDLVLSWPGGAASVQMTGPASTVFEGIIDVAALIGHDVAVPEREADAT